MTNLKNIIKEYETPQEEEIEIKPIEKLENNVVDEIVELNNESDSLSEEELINTEKIICEETNTTSVSYINIIEWYEKYRDELIALNIRKIRADSIQGVDGNNTILLSIPKEDKKELCLINTASNYKVLDLKPLSLVSLTQNMLQITAITEKEQIVRYYTGKPNLFIFPCVSINDFLLPYKMITSKRKNNDVKIPETINSEPMLEKLNSKLTKEHIEDLMLLYSINEKYLRNIETIKDLILVFYKIFKIKNKAHGLIKLERVMCYLLGCEISDVKV